MSPFLAQAVPGTRPGTYGASTLALLAVVDQRLAGVDSPTSMYLRRSLLREDGWRSANIAAISRILSSFAAAVPYPTARVIAGNFDLGNHNKFDQRLYHSGPTPHRSHSRSWYSSRSKEGDGAAGGKELHRLYEEQLLEMKEEREMLFGFTESDHSAWTSAGSNHRHDESFLDEINTARHYHMSQTRNDDEGSGSSAASPKPLAASSGDFPIHHSQTTRAMPMPTGGQTATETLDSVGRKPHAAASSDELFSHVSADGASVRMVDVGGKASTQRVAVAQTRVVFPPEVVQAFEGKQWVGPKGPIFATAKLAGIMAAKYVPFA
jgi:MoaC family